MRALAVCLVLLFFGAVSIGTSEQASAKGVWTDGSARVVKNTPSQIAKCPTYRQDVYVRGVGDTRYVCMYGDERLKIGTFIYDGSNRAVVLFPYSTEAHFIEGVCLGVVCHYSAETDTLVTTQQVSQFGFGLVVFNDVSERMKQTINEYGESKITFDSSWPDYELVNDVGQFIAVGAFSLSRNGEWIVVELRDRGVATINTQDFSTRHIVTGGYKYGIGMDPEEELAVSDDGKSAAIGGRNVGFSVIDITGECGQSLIGSLAVLPGTITCPSSDMQIGSYFPNFKQVERARFIGDHQDLELIVTSWVQGARRVIFSLHEKPSHYLKLLSLGDSFTSGEGDTDDKYYISGTNTSPHTCHVSTRSYPLLVANTLGIPDNQAKNIACSGATLGDVFGDGMGYWGQRSRLKTDDPNLSDSQKTRIQQDALDNFQPGVTLQSDFIEQYHPELIVLGIGGNDAGLMGKLRVCASVGTCEWASSDGVVKTGREISRLSGSLDSTYARIKEMAADSRIYVVGYPNIIEVEGMCDPATALLIDHTERLFIKNSIHYLNQVLHSSAAKAGFRYVDNELSFSGHALCSGLTYDAMNGVRFGDDMAIIGSLPMIKIIGSETFHPTPKGHQLMADAFIDQINTAVASVSNSSERPEYWNGDSSDVPEAYASQFAVDTNGGGALLITLPPGSLSPFSKATVQLRSEPTDITEITADRGGGVSAKVTIPQSVKSGFHTLHLMGVNREDVALDLYQFITVGDSEASLPITTIPVRPIPQMSGQVAVSVGVEAHQGPTVEQAPEIGTLPATFGAGVLGEKSTDAPVETRGVSMYLVWAIVAGIFVVTITSIAFVLYRKWVKQGT